MQILLTQDEYNDLIKAAKGQHLQQELEEVHSALEETFKSIVPTLVGESARRTFVSKLSKIRSERRN